MPMKRMLLVIAVVAGVVLAMSGCTSKNTVDPTKLNGTWKLESFGTSSGLEQAARGVRTELTLADGQASGNGGVNSFSGTYEASGDAKISFGALAATEMAGSPEAMAQEQRFFDALAKAKRYEFNGPKLVLADLGNNTLVILVPR